MNTSSKIPPRPQEPDLSATDSATIMVVRESTQGPEVFMVRRHPKSGFMANAYVYPGGKLDPSDCTEEAARHVVGLSPAQACARLGGQLFPPTALGLFLAGVRETFEEAGILLACRRGTEDPINLTDDPTTSDRFLDHRRRMIAGELALTELASREDLIVPLHEVGYFAHWITPHIESRRFDTRFFLALAPSRQAPLHDAVETTASTWIRPGAAIDQYQARELLLAPPTLRTLEQLAAFDTAQAALAFAQSHMPPTILPHFAELDGDRALLLPGDPEYPDQDPAYQIATPVDDGVTRMLLVDGLWCSQPVQPR